MTILHTKIANGLTKTFTYLNNDNSTYIYIRGLE